MLRQASKLLKKVEGVIYFPGWDFENVSKKGIARGARIQQAARGIAADNVDFDHGNDVPTRSLSYLVRYIGDMLDDG